MKIDGVFSGGGVKAFAFVGVLKSLHEKGLQLERVAGTSAGAIIASLIAAGYRYEQVQETLNEMDLKQLLDPPIMTELLPFTKWLYLYFQMGLNKGDRLEKWLYDLLAKRGVYTFNDLGEDRLKVVVSDLSLGKLIVIPDDLKRVYGREPESFSVATAIRMSCGFPYFFMPKKMVGKNNKKSLIVDGGILSNFPMWVFEQEHRLNKRPLLGVSLSEPENAPDRWKQINNVVKMSYALFSTMKTAHDARHISKQDSRNILYVPVTNVDTVDFYLSDTVKKELITLGETYANDFLQYWPG